MDSDKPTREDWEYLIKKFNLSYSPELICWDRFCDEFNKLLREEVSMSEGKPDAKTLQDWSGFLSEN